MSEFSRETLLNIIETDHVQCGEASALARMALAAMDSSESVELPLDYLQGHKDGLEWAAQLAEANHPETGDWLYDDPIELAKAIRKGRDMPPAQPTADSEPVAWTGEQDAQQAVVQKTAHSSVIAEQLAHVLSGLKVTDHQRAVISCAVDRLNNVAQLLQLSPSALLVPEILDYQGAKELYNYLMTEEEINATVNGWNACRAAMLQELKKSAGTEAICRSDENVQVLHTKSPAQSDCFPEQNHASPEQNGDTPAQSQGWIQVSEQMPPSRHEVLVGRWWGERPRWCCKWATYIPGHPDAQSSGWLIPGGSWTPTHWMELPAAPQEVKGE